MKQVAEYLTNLLLPPRCPISGEIVDRQGVFSHNVWSSLTFIEPPCCHACGLPFNFDMEAGALCAVCMTAPPMFTQARSAMVYDDASRNLILAFKHGDKLESVPAFIPFLKRAGGGLIEAADIIVPVPLHRWRLLRRRYNQSGLLAQGIGKACQKIVLPDALSRVRATPSQGYLNANQREANVKNAFVVPSKVQPLLRGKNILLVDDVYTTGSTLSECTKALLKAGAGQVNVLTLARVVRAERLA